MSRGLINEIVLGELVPILYDVVNQGLYDSFDTFFWPLVQHLDEFVAAGSYEVNQAFSLDQLRKCDGWGSYIDLS